MLLPVYILRAKVKNCSIGRVLYEKRGILMDALIILCICAYNFIKYLGS